MASLQQIANIGIIGTTIISICVILYKSLQYLYYHGKQDQRNTDAIKDLRTRVEYLETEIGNLHEDITKYRNDETRKLEEIRTNQAEMKTDIAVIKAILSKNFSP